MRKTRTKQDSENENNRRNNNLDSAMITNILFKEHISCLNKTTKETVVAKCQEKTENESENYLTIELYRKKTGGE